MHCTVSTVRSLHGFTQMKDTTLARTISPGLKLLYVSTCVMKDCQLLRRSSSTDSECLIEGKQTHLVFLCSAHILFSAQAKEAKVHYFREAALEETMKGVTGMFLLYLIVPLKRSFSGVEPTYRMWTLAYLGLMLVT